MWFSDGSQQKSFNNKVKFLPDLHLDHKFVFHLHSKSKHFLSFLNPLNKFDSKNWLNYVRVHYKLYTILDYLHTLCQRQMLWEGLLWPFFGVTMKYVIKTCLTILTRRYRRSISTNNRLRSPPNAFRTRATVHILLMHESVTLII